MFGRDIKYLISCLPIKSSDYEKQLFEEIKCNIKTIIDPAQITEIEGFLKKKIQECEYRQRQLSKDTKIFSNTAKGFVVGTLLDHVFDPSAGLKIAITTGSVFGLFAGTVTHLSEIAENDRDPHMIYLNKLYELLELANKRSMELLTVIIEDKPQKLPPGLRKRS